MKNPPRILAPQPITIVQPSVAAPPPATSLPTPPVTSVAEIPVKKTKAAPQKKSKLGSLTLKDQRRSKSKTSTDASAESETVRSVPEGSTAKPITIATSLVSQKTSDFKKGQLQSAAMDQPIVSSASSAPHTLSESNPSHLSSSRKVDIENKGLVTSVGDNTLISDATPQATDPGQISSNTALADEALLSTHSEAEAKHSTADDPSAKSPAGDDEAVEPMDTDSESDEKMISVTGASTAAVSFSAPVTAIPASTATSSPPEINVTTAPPATSTAAASPPATSAIPPTSPIKELSHVSLSSDNLSKMEGDDLHNSALAGDQGAQSNPPSSPKDTGDTSTKQLLMEFIASSQQQVKILTDERNELRQSLSELTDKVHSLASVYEPIPAWSSSMANKVKSIANAELQHAEALKIQAECITQLTGFTQEHLQSHNEAITKLTSSQQAMASDMLNYINATDGMVSEMKRTYDWNRISRAEVRALRYDSNKMFKQIRSMMVAFNNVFFDSGEKRKDEGIRKDMKDTLFDETYSMRTINEMPEFEEQAVAEELAESQQLEMDLGDDQEEIIEILNFPEYSFDELRNYELKVKEWAADVNARVQGENVNLDEKRWAYYEKYGPPKPKDEVTVTDGNDDDNNDDDDDDHMDEADDDESMLDQQPISVLTKRKRSKDSSVPESSSKSPPTKKHNTQVTDTTLSVTEIQNTNPITQVTDTTLSVIETTTMNPITQVTDISTSVINFEYPPISSSKEPESQLDSAEVLAAGYLSTSDYVVDDSVTFIQELIPPPSATQSSVIEQISLPMPTATVQPTESTIVTPISMSSSPIQTSSLSFPSDSTSGSLHPDETVQQRIERKIRERRESEREILLKFQEELNRKEEEDRKRKLKIQSDADRDYMMKISEQDAIEREIKFRLKEEQEANDALIAQLAEEDEKMEYERELKLEKGKKVAKPKKKGGASKTEQMLSEIDRKRYAQRMTGRSNPAPITKVLLRKPKNQGQPQLQIYRGLEVQAIALDQVCKLHREEWNEIRLAVSHSTSAAKKEVLEEIERLFQKMVDLQLLRPEDTVILGEEIIRPPSPRYRAGTSRIQRVPNTSRLNLAIPDNVLRMEGTEVTEGDIGLVYRDIDGKLRFQREAELEKIDHEQLLHLIRCVSSMRKDSHMRTAILSEAIARRFRYLPSKDKYELADELDQVKQEEVWRDE